MKYRIRQDETNKNNIIVEDVIEAEETLVEGYSVRYGVNVKKCVPCMI